LVKQAQRLDPIGGNLIRLDQPFLVKRPLALLEGSFFIIIAHMPTSQSSIQGITRGVYLGLDAHTFVTTPQTQVTVVFTGLEGDKHAGFTAPADSRTPWYPRGTEMRNSRQVSLVSVEELAEVAAALGVPEIRAEWLGANLLVGGIPGFTLLPPNTRLLFENGAALIITAENMPCNGPARVIAQQTGRAETEALFPKLAIHKRGLVACVDRPGIICIGEKIRIV